MATISGNVDRLELIKMIEHSIKVYEAELKEYMAQAKKYEADVKEWTSNLRLTKSNIRKVDKSGDTVYITFYKAPAMPEAPNINAKYNLSNDIYMLKNMAGALRVADHLGATVSAREVEKILPLLRADK